MSTNDPKAETFAEVVAENRALRAELDEVKWKHLSRECQWLSDVIRRRDEWCDELHAEKRALRAELQRVERERAHWQSRADEVSAHLERALEYIKREAAAGDGIAEDYADAFREALEAVAADEDERSERARDALKRLEAAMLWKPPARTEGGDEGGRDMNFGVALEQMRTKWVRRRAWRSNAVTISTGSFVWMHPGGAFTDEDLLADDWEVVP
jgi:predicted RNase H-like nuclease (RuvC/YqgF family)